MRKAIIESSTGLVINVIEFELDDSGGYAHWECPADCELVDAVGDAQIGSTWDGSQFTAPVKPTPPRLVVLMAEGPAVQVYDEIADVRIDRPAEDIAADKAELLGLLHTKLAETGDLSWEEMNKMLALERES